MSVVPSSRVARRRFAARAATLAAAALLGACIVPPRPVATAPDPLPSTPPAISSWSPNVFPGGSAQPSLFFSTDRPGYAAVFEVDRLGRARVVYPASPRDAGRVQPGKTYVAVSNGLAADRTVLTPAINWRRLPFLFVVVSDVRPDLSAFGRGRSWQRQLRVDAVEAEDVIASVAQAVGAAGRPYATDFAYVAPRLSATEARFASGCARAAQDARDYNYFRDLWAVFTPADPTYGIASGFALGPMVTWASAPYLGLAASRVVFASAAFTGSCLSPGGSAFRQQYALQYALPGRVQPGTVAVAPPPTPGPRTVPPGAVPVQPRIPRIPLAFADSAVRPIDAPAGGVPVTPERLTPVDAAPRRPMGVRPEPLDRPAGEPMRRWGTPGTWGGSSGAVDDAGAPRSERVGARADERVVERARVRDEGGWAEGGRRAADRPVAAEPRAADRPVAAEPRTAEAPRPPMREPVREPVGGGRLGEGSGGAVHPVAPVAPGGGGGERSPGTAPPV